MKFSNFITFCYLNAPKRAILKEYSFKKPILPLNTLKNVQQSIVLTEKFFKPVLGAVPGALFSKARCPVRCSVLSNLKPGARYGAWCYQSRKSKHWKTYILFIHFCTKYPVSLLALPRCMHQCQNHYFNSISCLFTFHAW